MSRAPTPSAPDAAEVDPRIAVVIEEGRDIADRFRAERGRDDWHPFIPANYDRVLTTLRALFEPGTRFLEWGSGNGVITIVADLLGYDACGIELDADLVDIARDLAGRYHSDARFAAGSFLPQGYHWRAQDGDNRMGTIGEGESGYLLLGRPLDDFDLVFGYPWPGEEPVMRDVMRRYAGEDARLLLCGGMAELTLYRRPFTAPLRSSDSR